MVTTCFTLPALETTDVYFYMRLDTFTVGFITLLSFDQYYFAWVFLRIKSKWETKLKISSKCKKPKIAVNTEELKYHGFCC